MARTWILAAALAALAAWPAAAQLRPMARPGDLAVATPVAPPPETVVPAGLAPEAAIDALGGLEGAAPEASEEPPVGPVTGLPLPRYVSLKTAEGNARRGPSLDHRIDWTFVRRDMPLRLTAEYGHWRRVEDRDGEGGWIHYSLLSGTRTVIVDQDMLPLRSREDERATEVAQLQAGVVAHINSCTLDWCRLTAGGFTGWAPKTALWGVGADEVLD